MIRSVSMFHWLAVTLLTVSMAIGPSVCCCPQRFASALLSGWTTAGQECLQSQTDCCALDASGKPACCSQSQRTTNSNQTEPDGSQPGKSAQDCCGNGKHCVCPTASQAITLPSSFDSDFEWTLHDLKAGSSLCDSPFFNDEHLKLVCVPYASIGLVATSSLCMIQRWNC